MATESAHPPPSNADAITPGTGPSGTSQWPISSKPSQRYKSWRKKFRKMKRVFDDKMRESNDLVRDEHKMWEISRRLAAQNDMILDILVDQNESTQVPGELRIDVYDEEDPQTRGKDPIKIAEEKLLNAEIMPHEMADVYKASELRSKRAGLKHLNHLLQIPHTRHPTEEQLRDMGAAFEDPIHLPPGYLPIERMEALARQMDIALHQPDESELNLPPLIREVREGREGEDYVDETGKKEVFMSDKGLAIENPVSVYNYLRRHHASIFLQDVEPAPEKPSKKEARADRASAAEPASSRSTKRKRPKGSEEMDLDDDDSNDFDFEGPPVTSHNTSTGTGRVGKRQREDDAAYRPKGGGGSKSKGKRKRDEGSDAYHGGSRKKMARGSNVSATMAD